MSFKILNGVTECTLLEDIKSKSWNKQMEMIIFPNQHSHQNQMVVFIKSSYTNNPKTFILHYANHICLPHLLKEEDIIY